MSKQTYITLKKQLFSIGLNEFEAEHIASRLFLIRGDCMEAYSDNELRYTLSRFIAALIPREESFKEKLVKAERIITNMYPEEYELKYSIQAKHTSTYNGNKATTNNK